MKYVEVKFIDGPRVGTSRWHYNNSPPYTVVPLPVPKDMSSINFSCADCTVYKVKDLKLLYELICMPDDFGEKVYFYRLTANSKQDYIEYLIKYESKNKDFFDKVMKHEKHIFNLGEK